MGFCPGPGHDFFTEFGSSDLAFNLPGWSHQNFSQPGLETGVDMQPVLVWGRHGMLAQAIRRTWPRDGKTLFLGRADLPAGRAQQYEKICRLAPSAILNASGFTNLKRAEECPHLARDLHVETPAFLAEITRSLGIPFATISSDYVFSGRGQSAWSVPNQK